ncbi:MAG: protein kinase, partial [Planctomycetota bacterium]|nr:protein kinase [Planctomycetota bacterium]
MSTSFDQLLAFYQNELDDYELIQVLGRGQSSLVFHAKNKAFNLDVSLKILEKSDPDFEERFVREFRLLYTFNHPNIAPVRDCGRTRSGRYFFTTNYLGGETISSWLENRGPFEVTVACKVMLQLLSALEYCHSHDV